MSAQLALALDEPLRTAQARPAARRNSRGPRGCRVGDEVLAEGSRWTVVALDEARKEAVCRLVAGSRVLRRFRARQIVKVRRQKAAVA